MSAGALVFQMDDEPAGVLYGVGTWGDTDRSATFGLGYAFAGEKIAKRPLAMLGGEARVARRLALLTENYFVAGKGNPIVSYGIRTLGERLSVDLAFVNRVGEEMVFPGFLFVGFAVKP